MGLFDRFKSSKPVPERGDDAAIAALVRDLGDAEWEVRRNAARALGEMGAAAEAAVPPLEEAISDEHGEVCLAASDALSKIRRAAH